mgnify:CR=1 FL=1
MTPIALLDCLKEFAEGCTKDIILPIVPSPKIPEGERSPEVWKMRLPDRESETKKAPYILLQLINGIDQQEEGNPEDSTCNVRIVVGVYADDDSEGALNVLNVITRLRQELLRVREIGKCFSLRTPLEYLVYPDRSTAPFYFGEMMTTWEMPTIKREVPELLCQK